MGQTNRAAELSQLRIDTQKALLLPPKEILERYSKAIQSIVIENGKVVKLGLYKL